MDDRGTVTMSRKELNRLQILGRVLERRLTQAKAAEQLGLSLRQVERPCRTLRREAPEGLVSTKRGRPSNRRVCPTGSARTHSRSSSRTTWTSVPRSCPRSCGTRQLALGRWPRSARPVGRFDIDGAVRLARLVMPPTSRPTLRM